MFERFTDGARRVVVLAQEEARLLDHDAIGTEHVLLGMLHEGVGVAAQALESATISLESARAQVEVIGRPRPSSPDGHIPFTPRAKKTLELALREAWELDADFIDTEHLLLALLREGQGVAVEVLVNLGADLGRLREQALQLTGREAPDRIPPETPEIRPAPTTHQSLLHCSFCNEPQNKVAKLIAGPGVYICDRCVALCQEILDEQVTPPASDPT